MLVVSLLQEGENVSKIKLCLTFNSFGVPTPPKPLSSFLFLFIQKVHTPFYCEVCVIVAAMSVFDIY